MYDVLIVGAGPVGLTTAIKLIANGINVRLIDGAEKPAHITKASGMATRSLELLPEDVVKDMQNRGVRVGRLNIYETNAQSASKKIVELNLAEASDTFKGILAQPQWSFEEALRTHLEKINGSVEWGTRLVSFENNANQVVAKLQLLNGTEETIKASWLIACDGGRSTVRSQLNLSFPGITTPEYFFALHATFKGLNGHAGTEPGRSSAATELLFSKKSDKGGKDEMGNDTSLQSGMVFSMPMPESQPNSNLIIVDLSKEQAARFNDGTVDKHGRQGIRQPTPEEVVEVMRVRGFGNKDLSIEPGSLKWCTQFTINSRVVEHYRSGRVFLAGDAAHCHTPLGGQGMNMGIQDAVNLSWKLSMVIKGHASPTLLDSYDEERRKTDKRIVGAIETAQKAASDRSALVFFLRGMGQRAVSLMGSFFAPIMTRMVNMQIHSYSGLSLAQEHWERPPVSPFPLTRIVYPFPGGYRRQQNLYRWVSHRVRAGDRIPNLNIAASDCKIIADVQQTAPSSLYPYKSGWMLLMLEGSIEHNQCQASNLSADAKPKSFEQLVEEGHRIKKACSPLIDSVCIVPASAFDVHEILGVRGQCLLLIRPDAYIGFRSEPIRAGAVIRYFAETVKAPIRTNDKQFIAPSGASSFDSAPLVAWATIAAAASIFFMYSDFSNRVKFDR